MSTLRRVAISLALLATLSPLSRASAGPLVTFRVAGEPGAWVLDFSVSNTLGVPDLDVYLFGLALPGAAVVGVPPYWELVEWETWTNEPGGGSSTVYDTGWLNLRSDPLGTQIVSGATTGGFRVRVATASAPTAVPWFAYAFDFTSGTASYTGDDFFYSRTNPGFEGVATVPEPAPLRLLAMGLVVVTSLVGIRFRRSVSGLREHVQGG